MHQDHVSVLPPGFELLGSTDLCPVQIMKHSNRHLSFQGHPEFCAAHVEKIIVQVHASSLLVLERLRVSLSLNLQTRVCQRCTIPWMTS